MIEHTKIQKDNMIIRQSCYKEDPVTGSKAYRKDNILKQVSLSDQINSIRKYLINPSEENLQILKEHDKIISDIISDSIRKEII
jgi:hypothetical protein